jgi:signal transduction histidine kinase
MVERTTAWREPALGRRIAALGSVVVLVGAIGLVFEAYKDVYRYDDAETFGDSISLAGMWEVVESSATSPPPPGAGWTSIEDPLRSAPREPGAEADRVIWLRRPMPAGAQQHVRLILGNLWASRAELFLDAESLGPDEAATQTRAPTPLQRISGWDLPPDAASAEWIQIRMQCMSDLDCRLADTRLMLLTAPQVRAVRKTVAVRWFAAAAIATLCTVLGALVVGLGWIRRRSDPRLALTYVVAGLSAGCAALYTTLVLLPYATDWVPNPYLLYAVAVTPAYGGAGLLAWFLLRWTGVERQWPYVSLAALHAVVFGVGWVGALLPSGALIDLWLIVGALVSVVSAAPGYVRLLVRLWREPNLTKAPFAAAVGAALGAGVHDGLMDASAVEPGVYLFGIGAIFMCAAAGFTALLHFLSMERTNVALTSTLADQNEQLTEALARAEDASRVRDDFLANMSHELRTPLNAVVNLPKLLLRQLDDTDLFECEQCGAVVKPDEGEQITAETVCPECETQGQLVPAPSGDAAISADQLRPDLTLLRTSGEHLLALVNDILDARKLRSLSMSIDAKVIEFAPVARAAIDIAEGTGRERGVVVAHDLAAGVRVEGDALRLRQVIVNLLGNAIKHSPDGGTVTVVLKAIGDHARLTVTDQGPGIAKDQQPLVFEAFRQIETAHTKIHGGTGLGLTIAKHFTELHHGELTVESELEAGATFVVRLPLAPLHGKATDAVRGDG